MSNISYKSNEGKLFFFNFSPWRMVQIEPFFYAPNNKKIICRGLSDALERGLDGSSRYLYMGLRDFPMWRILPIESPFQSIGIERCFYSLW